MTVTIGAVLASIAGGAWALDPGSDLRRLTYQAWGVDNGLPQETVHAIAQTPDGYLWLGTHGGLVRTDGVRFVVFDRQRSSVLGSAWINDLLVDRNGVLWIAANSGLYSYADERFSRWDSRFGMPNARVLRLALSRRGIWFSTYAGDLGHWDGVTVSRFTPDDGAPPGAAWELQEIDGTLWIGTWSHGLWRHRDGRFEALDLLDGSHGAWAVERDGDDGLWVGTDDGLFHVDGDGTALRLGAEHGLSRSFIQALRLDRDGNLWVGTNGGGLHRLTWRASDPTSARIQRVERARAVPGRQIWELFEDREGQLWVGTFGGGLERFGETLIETYLPGDGAFRQVNAVYADTDGCLWLATHTDGVWRRCEGRPTEVFDESDGLPTAGAWTVTRDRDGTLWVGTARGLLYRRDGGAFHRIGVEDGLHNAVVLALHPARAGGVWVGTNGGLARVEPTTIEIVDPDRLPSLLVRGIDEESDGTVWIGTSGAGLVRLDARSPADDRVYGTADGLPDMLVWSLLRDRKGTLWIGTSGGLARFVGGRIETLDARHGLVPDSVSSLLEDPAGDFWLGTPAGILHVERQQLDAFFLDGVSPVVTRHFGTAEGMISTEFLGGVQPSAAYSADGRVWFPSLAGVAVIDPETVPGAAPSALPIIEELISDGVIRSTRLAEHRLAPSTRRVEFRFTAPSTHAAARLRFRYRLIGFDDAWIESGGQRNATFTNLAPADYAFEVAVRHESGAWSEPAVVHFSIEPRFYQRTGFLLLLSCLVVASAIAFHRIRTHALRWRRDELEREVRETVARLKVLSGLLPICAACKKVRDDRGYWNRIEEFISANSEAEFSHGMCPDCSDSYRSQYNIKPFEARRTEDVD